MRRRFLIIILAFSFLFLFLLKNEVLACPNGQCYFWSGGSAYCASCGGWTPEDTDPTCECSGTQCCQSDGQCGPCGGSGQWKGRHIFAYLDNDPHRLWRPDFSWDSATMN